MANIVMTTHWTSGDVDPFIRLGRRLRQRGHSVTLITHCVYAEAARQAGIAFIANDTPEEWAIFVAEKMPAIAAMLNTVQNIASVAQDYNTEDEHHSRCETMRRELALIKDCCAAPDTILVARHTSSLPALLAAEALDLPIVSVFMAPSQVAQSLLDEAMVGEIMVKDVNAIRATLGFAPIRSWSAWINAARQHLGLWPEWFAAPESDWPVVVTPVGFPIDHAATSTLAELPADLRALLEGGKRPLLISGGSGKIIRAEFYHVAVAACALLERPSLVVTEHRELLPPTLPDHIHWYPYLPFAALLPLTGAMIHHGGIGSICQALLAGVPQLVLAHGLDRPDNAMRLKQLGGSDSLSLARWQPALIAESLQALLQPAVAARCHALAARLHASSGLDRAAAAIEQAASAPDSRLDQAHFLASSQIQAVAANQTPPDLQADHAGNAKLSQLTPDQLALLVRRLKQKKERV